MKKRLLFMIVLVCAVSVAFVGCSKDEEGVIKFAGSGGYPPFNFINEDNEVDGFDVDVAREIAKRLGGELEYVTTAWDGIIEGLRAGRYDGILGSMAITEERLKVVDFSTPYYYSGAQLITRNDSGISGFEDIGEETKIGVATGTTFADDVEKLSAVVRLYEDDNQTLMELVSGRIDAVITDRVVGLNAMKRIRGGDDLVLAGSLLRTEECAIAFKKDSALTDKVNAIIEDMRRDGTLAALSAKWFDGADITVQ